MIAKARRCSYLTLLTIESEDANLPTALAIGRKTLSDNRDQKLLLDIVTGTVRWKRLIDYLIKYFSQKELSKIDIEIRIILRLSIYQLLYLDRVPAAAVVSDAVNLTRAVRKKSATTFVNGVLRTLIRQRHRLPIPSRPTEKPSHTDAASYLGIAYSHPDWLVKRWLKRFGFESTEAWVKFNNEIPSVMLRVNRLKGTKLAIVRKLSAEGIKTEPSHYSPDGLRVITGNPVKRNPDGLFFIQDEASQLIAPLLGIKNGDTVLDLCAAPGGKTTQLASIVGDQGLVVASDVRRNRLKLLKKAVSLSGSDRIRIVAVGSSGSLPYRISFDRVLVDAPCSGLGTIRRDPDIRWKRQPEELTLLAKNQGALLDRAATIVKLKGRLVYATCSTEPEENEDVIDSFLDRQPNFKLLDFRTLPIPSALNPLIDDRGMFRTRPFLDHLDGFFAAALSRV
jgi:16S rRNA (cytosine967-C5)-methyltransferase